MPIEAVLIGILPLCTAGVPSKKMYSLWIIVVERQLERQESHIFLYWCSSGALTLCKFQAAAHNGLSTFDIQRSPQVKVSGAQYYQEVSSSNLSYWFNSIPTRYFKDIDKMVLLFILRGKRIRIDKTILKEKSKLGGLVLHAFKTYYKAIIILTVYYWENIKNRQIVQWSRIEGLERDQKKCGQLILQGSKTIQWSKNNLFNKWYWNNWTSICKWI